MTPFRSRFSRVASKSQKKPQNTQPEKITKKPNFEFSEIEQKLTIREDVQVVLKVSSGRLSSGTDGISLKKSTKTKHSKKRKKRAKAYSRSLPRTPDTRRQG